MGLPDLSKLSEDELLVLRKEVDKALVGHADARRKAALDAAHQAAKAAGFDLHDLLGGKPARTPSRGRAPAAARYANPADASQTWNGRGRPPKWFSAALEAGTAREAMALR